MLVGLLGLQLLELKLRLVFVFLGYGRAALSLLYTLVYLVIMCSTLAQSFSDPTYASCSACYIMYRIAEIREKVSSCSLCLKYS
jgi:hypothetical protein